MTGPNSPGGLEPLNREPSSLYPPFLGGQRTWLPFPAEEERYIALLSALDGVELGSYDVRVLQWLADRDAPTVATVCSLIHRAHAAGYCEGSTNP
jgi:hypothetical protein